MFMHQQVFVCSVVCFMYVLYHMHVTSPLLINAACSPTWRGAFSEIYLWVTSMSPLQIKNTIKKKNHPCSVWVIRTQQAYGRVQWKEVRDKTVDMKCSLCHMLTTGKQEKQIYLGA